MVTQIDPISTPPTPSDAPAVFEERASQVWADLYKAVPKMNQQALDIEAIGRAADIAKRSAQDDSDRALGYRNEANAAKTAAQGHAGSAAQSSSEAGAATDLAKAAAGRAEVAAAAAEDAVANAVRQTSGTGAAILPDGPAANRPNPQDFPAPGLLFRGNSSVGRPEFFNRVSNGWETFGTASTKDVVTHPIIAEAGKVITVGYAGLGQRGVTAGSYDWYNPGGFNGFQFEGDSNTPGSPAGGNGSSYAINMCSPDGLYAHQIGAAISLPELKFRNKNNGAWGPWYTLWHAGNLDVGAIFGIGQTWKNVTGSRSTGVVYTNTSRKFIVLQVQGSTNSPGPQVELLLSGAWQTMAAQGGVTGQTSTVFVPPGISYRFGVTPVVVMELS